MNADEKMLVIQALDADAKLLFSSYTHQWYIEARIERGNGVFLTGVSEHRDTPDAAVDAFFHNITELSLDEFLVSRYLDRRREWTWNGAAFAECTRELVFEKESAR